MNPEISQTLRKNLQESLKQCRFVRAGKIELFSKPIIRWVQPTEFGDELSFTSLKQEELPSIFEDVKNKHVSMLCNKFKVKSGVRLPRRVNERDVCPVVFRSDCIVYPVFSNGEFSFPSYLAEFYTVPFTSATTSTPSDLICYLVDEKLPSNEWKWFCCSDQFMRFWTIINFDSHISFFHKKTKSQSVKSTAVKESFFRGNSLVVDAWKKWLVACQENDIIPSHEESIKKFFVKRCETISLTYLDIYSALVLASIYGEAPTYSNITTTGVNAPKLADSASQPQRQKWMLPKEFFSTLTKLGINENEVEEIKHKSQEGKPKVEISVVFEGRPKNWADENDEEGMKAFTQGLKKLEHNRKKEECVLEAKNNI